MTVTNLSADECGWRQYPVPLTVFRFEATSPDYYLEADTAELIASRNWDVKTITHCDGILDRLYGRGVELLSE